MQIKVIIADDHPIFRRGLKEIIEEDERIKIISEARDGIEAIEKISNLKPDIAIIDIDMPEKNGFQVVNEINNLRTKIIFLTMYKEENFLNKALDAGVSGYVLKESAVDDINECILTVFNGTYYISPQISGFIINRTTKKDKESYHGIDLLTPSEIKILKLIADNKTSKEISDKLFISYRTVEKHRTNISNKLGLHGTHSLLKFAIENKSVFKNI